MGRDRQRAWEAVLLLGPPGSGKSWLGRRLAAEGVVRFPDLEPELVARFGRGEAFAARKAEALAYVAAAWDAVLAEPGPPLAIESTGLSDAPNLAALRAGRRVLVARLDTPRETCIARVAARSGEGQLNNDAAFAARFHDHWAAEIAPRYPAHLVLTGQDADLEALRRALAAG